MAFDELIFPRDNLITRGDLRLVHRIQRGRVFNPTVPVLGVAAWIDTQRVWPGYNQFQFDGMVTGVVTVDWGDGSTPQLVTAGRHTFQHIYSSPGVYLVKLTFAAGNHFEWRQSEADEAMSRQIIKAYIDRTPPDQPPIDSPFGK